MCLEEDTDGKEIVKSMGGPPGLIMDFTVEDPWDGRIWDFNDPLKAEKALMLQGAVHKCRRHFLRSLTPLGAYVSPSSAFGMPQLLVLQFDNVTCEQP